jgi:hypothetical protein
MSRRVWIGIAAYLLVAPPLGLLWIAERGEVAVLESGPERERTRVWVVDRDARSFVRGNRDGAWVGRVRETPEVRLRRGAEWRRYTAVLRTEEREAVVAAMRAKYGVSERFRSAMRGDEASVVFELTPTRE